MRAAAGPREMLASPVGRYLAGPSWLVWVYSPTLAGVAFFGQPSESERAELEPLFAVPAHPALKAPYDVLADCSELEAVSPWAFDFTARYLDVARRSAKRMRRVAIARPPGHAGIVLAGVFYELVRGSFTAGLFADRQEALAWLGHDQLGKARAELDELVGSLRGKHPALPRLRQLLRRDYATATVADSARSLGMSPRALQRTLTEAHTSFRRQVEHARLRAAESLLTEEALKLEAVARRVGYSSLPHFTVAFRRATGETPSDFRRRRKP
jgi:AraC-like DNA-binding protein